MLRLPPSQMLAQALHVRVGMRQLYPLLRLAAPLLLCPLSDAQLMAAPSNRGCEAGACDCDVRFARCLGRQPVPLKRAACPVPAALHSTPDPDPLPDANSTHAEPAVPAFSSPTFASRHPQQGLVFQWEQSDDVGQGGGGDGGEEEEEGEEGEDGMEEGRQKERTRLCSECAGGPWRNSFFCYLHLLACKIKTSVG